MKPCSTCGNDIETRDAVCPFCEQPQRGGTPARPSPAGRIFTLHLKAGLPTVEQALERLERERSAGPGGEAGLVRIVHGWGSGGRGGALRTAVRARLSAWLRARSIRGVVFGEAYDRTTPAGRRLLRTWPALRRTLASDRKNPGITFVEW